MQEAHTFFLQITLLCNHLISSDMKRFLNILEIVLALSIIATSCEKEKAPFLTLSTPKTIHFTDQGGTQSITFTANRDWSVSSADSWCKVSPSSGNKAEGSITVTLTCEPNTTYDPRSATLTVRVEDLSETITVTQDTNLGLLVSPTSYDLTNAAQTIEVEVRANVKYAVEIDAACKDWITQTGTKALSTEKITFSIAANESYDNREASVTIKQTDGPLAETVRIKQAQTDGLFITTPEYNLSNESHTLSVEVQANVSFEVTPEAEWIHYVQTKALNSSTITLTIDANDTYAARSGKVSVKLSNDSIKGEITVNQTEKVPAITGMANNITEKSVLLAGAVNPTSDMQDVLMGVLYSLDKNLNIENGIKVRANNGGNNEFTVELDGLSSSTTYYYKTYLQYNGEQYYFGEIKSFSTETISATVSTLAASDITELKCILNGKLEVSSKASLSRETWFLYDVGCKEVEELIQSGMSCQGSLFENGLFTADIRDLECGANYSYVAVARVYDKLFYGEVVSLNTLSIDASVTNMETTDITEFAASLHGSLSLNSQEPMSKSVFFLYSKTAATLEELIINGNKVESSVEDDGAFSSQLSNLDYDTGYYFVAAAIVHNRVFYAENVSSFKTLSINATISTEGVTDITETQVKIHGKLVDVSNESFSKDVWFLFSKEANTLDGLKESGQRVNSSLLDDGAFSSELTNLEPGIQYHYVACARVYDKEFYSDVVSFTTRDLIYTTEASDVCYSIARLNGVIKTNNTGGADAQVWFIYSSSPSFEGDNHTVASSVNNDGVFYADINGLSKQTEYYYKAVSQIQEEIVYGEVLTFTTKCMPSRAVDLGIVMTRNDGRKYELLWAEENVGESLYANYGGYYPWGDIVPKATEYKWDSYKWANGAYDRITKYCRKEHAQYWDGEGEPDNKTVLDLVDDIAHVEYGGEWRMPTVAEFKALIEQCTWYFKTNGNSNGVWFISKAEGNNNRIFLPMTGNLTDANKYPNYSNLTDGHYWTSSLSEDAPFFAYCLYIQYQYNSSVPRFNLTEEGLSNDSNRYLGYSVRAVTE